MIFLFAAIGATHLARAEMKARFPGPYELVRVTGNILDFDGDGFSGVLGGTDCDDWDERSNTDGVEIIGNGFDENCMGGGL